MLVLAPLTPPERLARHAEAIAQATSDETEAAALVVIDFAETSFRDRPLPFGALTMPGAWHATRAEVAAWAVGVLRTGQRQCGAGWWARLGFYVTGTCARSAEGMRRARMLGRLVR